MVCKVGIMTIMNVLASSVVMIVNLDVFTTTFQEEVLMAGK